MKNIVLILFTAWLGTHIPAAQAQFVDCSCLASQAVLKTNACQGVIPDMCQFTNCFKSTVQPPPPLSCSQTPAPGGIVGPGTYPITVTVTDPNGVGSQCTMNFVVTAPTSGPFSLACATNKTVECNTTWQFDPPTPVNPCCPNPGTPGTGVVIRVVSTVSNGKCPQIITQTWQDMDACGHTDMCSQTVTVVDSTPPVINCACLRDFGKALLQTNACSGIVPDLCQFKQCYTDNCGPISCFQSPAAGTVVGPGITPITLTIKDCAGNAAA